MGADRWTNVARYPVNGAEPTTYYLDGGPSGSGAPSQNDGKLTTTPPTSPTGADRVLWSGATSPCSRGTEQWGAGGLQLVLDTGMLPPDPCAQNDLTMQTGPGALTYTTTPFTQATTLAGPIDATIYASATSTDSEWVATLEDVAPDGTSFPLTSGALLGSFRQLDASNTWLAPDGRPLLPYHPYTQASQTPVLPGIVTRYDVEVFPTFAQLAPGHRLRLTLNTSDTPHLLPIPAQVAKLTGGVYEVQHNTAAASFLEVPIAPASTFPTTPQPAPSGPTLLNSPGCPHASGHLNGRTLGPVSLGMTRTRARRAFLHSSNRRRLFMDFFCLTPNGIRVGYPSPKLLRMLPRADRRRVQGRVVLALTANPHYTLRRALIGARLATVARKLKTGEAFHIGLNYWYLAPDGQSTAVLKVRHGRIEEIGIADKRLTRTRRSAQRLLKSFY